MPGLFGLFFWLDIGYLGIGRKEMVQILIGLKFFDGDGLGRDKSGTVLLGSRIGQVVIIINSFLVFLIFHKYITSGSLQKYKKINIRLCRKREGYTV